MLIVFHHRGLPVMTLSVEHLTEMEMALVEQIGKPREALSAGSIECNREWIARYADGATTATWSDTEYRKWLKSR